MGNQPTVEMRCEVDSNSYHPGETIHGNVHLSVTGQRPVKDFKGIRLTFAGVEQYVPTDNNQDSDSSSLDISTSSSSQQSTNQGYAGGGCSRRIVKLRKSVVTFEEDAVLQPGEYVYPFELVLPNHNGDSDYSVVGSSSQNVQVSYRIRAQMQRKPNVPWTIDNDISAFASCR